MPGPRRRLDRTELILWLEFGAFAAVQIYFIVGMVSSAIASL